MHTSGRSVLQQLSYFIHGRIQWPLKVAPPAERSGRHGSRVSRRGGEAATETCDRGRETWPRGREAAARMLHTHTHTHTHIRTCIRICMDRTRINGSSILFERSETHTVRTIVVTLQQYCRNIAAILRCCCAWREKREGSKQTRTSEHTTLPIQHKPLLLHCSNIAAILLQCNNGLCCMGRASVNNPSKHQVTVI